MKVPLINLIDVFFQFHFLDMQQNEGTAISHDINMEVSVYTKASAMRVLREDSPLLMQFDNTHGEKFYYLFDDLVSTEEGSNSKSPKDQCPLPYQRNRRPSPERPAQNDRLPRQWAVRNGPVKSRRPARLGENICILCKNNGKCRDFYTNHMLKDSRGKVTCPVLRDIICPASGATRDNAHTLSHCRVKSTYARRAIGYNYHRRYPINNNRNNSKQLLKYFYHYI